MHDDFLILQFLQLTHSLLLHRKPLNIARDLDRLKVIGRLLVILEILDAQMQKLTASPGASSRSKAQSKRSEYLDFMSKEMKKANQRWNALKKRKSSSRK